MPSPRRNVMTRARLVQLLGAATDARLTLVSAPAGFGKTTLVTEWAAAVADTDLAVAWVALDAHDDDPVTFWSYVFAAVDVAVPGLGINARALLEGGDTPTSSVVATFLNELDATDLQLLLVLDDLHLIERPEIHEALTDLVDRLPVHAHVMVTTRADPPLPLARLRARGELVEVRAADLRFTADEAAAYLNGAMGLSLTAADVAALEARTEGWIAALQLAALSMQGRADPAEFIASFAGDDRFVVDYLVGEVLQRLPDDVRQFLLRTSVLDRCTGSLCDVVADTTNGQQMLADLERDNLFVVPLDDRREWYRYHQLFAEVLRAHLADEDPTAPASLHRRAAQWYAAHGEPTAAVAHCFAADDVDTAAAIAERAMPALRRSRHDATIREWAQRFPAPTVQERPVLAMGLVGAHMFTGRFDLVEQCLADVERWWALDPDARAASGRIVVDETQLPAVPGAIEMYRAAMALTRGDVAATVTHARRLLEVAPPDDTMGRSAAHALLGLASWSMGDLDVAFAEYTDAVTGMERVGHVADVLGCTISMADIRVAQGRLRDAERLYEQGLALVAEHGAGPLRGTADMHVGLAEILRERDDRAAAADHLRRAAELELYGTAQYPYRSRTVRAGLLLAEGDTAGCLALLDEAEQLYDTDYSPAVRPVAARRARTHVRRGELAAARAWVEERGLTTDDDATYVTEFEHVTLALVLLNDHPDDRCLQRVSALLDRLLVAAEAGGRGSSVIEILAVQAMTFDARGDRAAAIDALRRAQELAAPEGYVRVFSFLGPRLDGLRRSSTSSTERRSAGAAASPFVDPLSERELEVLRYLRSDLSGPDIARALHVSLNTLRTHTQRIYTKLGVTSRREAVSRADALGL
ncbi:MAG: LuxR C-terminal-related transcriptional regulator [Acidimicrobiia bacterium]